MADLPAEVTTYGKRTVDLQNVTEFDWLLQLKPSPSPKQIADHVHFIATELTDKISLEPVEVRRFLEQNPQIRRAKGWFRDGNGDQWHLQAVGDTCTIEPSVARPTGLVFIHLADAQIDLECLVKGV